MSKVPKGLQVLTMSDKPDKQALRLLEQNTIGTPGVGMLYKHHDVAGKLANLKHASFCSLSIRGKLYGTICFCRRLLRIDGNTISGYYVRYFTFLDHLRAAKDQQRRGKEGKVRKEVRKVLDGTGLDHQEARLFYAYVDQQNVRSGKLIEEFGFEKVGSFRVLTFSRFSPKKHFRVKQVGQGQLAAYFEASIRHYQKYQLFFEGHMQQNGTYYAVWEEGKIVCGAQAIVDQWDIVALPGWKGKLMMRFVPHLPLVKRLFDSKYRFVFLEGIFCDPGKEKWLTVLMESILSEMQVHSGILTLDATSDKYKMISKVPLGLVHWLMGEKTIDIVIKSNLTKVNSAKAPFFISGYDVL